MKATPSQAFVGRVEALADPTRLRLLRLLERHELGVTEMCEVLQLPQSTVSRHLKQLVDQSWLANRRRGTSNLYRLEPNLAPSAHKLWKTAREEVAVWPSTNQDERRLSHHLDERRNTSRSFFAGAAASWDAMRTQLYGGRFASLVPFALLPSSWCVADLGCGTGALCAELSPFVERVIGVDQSPAMLSAARRRLEGRANVELREGLLEALPIDEGACDAALLILTLTYVADPAAVLQELARILRPGGHAVIVDLLPHDREDFRRELGQQASGFGDSELGDLLHTAGLSCLRIQPIAPEPQAKGPALFIASCAKAAQAHKAKHT